MSTRRPPSDRRWHHYVVLAVLGLFVAVSSPVANDGQYFAAVGASAGNFKHQAVTRSDRSLLTQIVERGRVDLGTGGTSGLAPGPAAVACVVAQHCRIVAIESPSLAIPVRFCSSAQPRAPPTVRV